MDHTDERGKAFVEEFERRFAEILGETLFMPVIEKMPAWVFANLAEALDGAANTAARIFANIEADSDSSEDARRDFAELMDRLAMVDAMMVLACIKRTDMYKEAVTDHLAAALVEAAELMDAEGGESHGA